MCAQTCPALPPPPLPKPVSTYCIPASKGTLYTICWFYVCGRGLGTSLADCSRRRVHKIVPYMVTYCDVIRPLYASKFKWNCCFPAVLYSLQNSLSLSLSLTILQRVVKLYLCAAIFRRYPESVARAHPGPGPGNVGLCPGNPIGKYEFKSSLTDMNMFHLNA